MSTQIGSYSTSPLLATRIPDFTDTANIQNALKQLYFGTANGATTSQTDGIYGALYTLYAGSPILGASNGTVTIAGNLTVNGTTVTFDTQTLSVEDPLIYLAKSQYSVDLVDIGIYGAYGATTHITEGDHYHTGLIRKAGGGWHLISAGAEPVSNSVSLTGVTYDSLKLGNIILPGATSGTITLKPTAIAGTTELFLPAVTSDTLVGKTTTDTLTNKSLSDSTTFVVDVTDETKKIKFDVGNTTNITGTIATAFTTAKTLTLPDATDTLVGKGTTDVLTNKSFSDATTHFVDVVDNTKKLNISVTGTTGITGVLQTAFTTAKTISFPDLAGTVALTSLTGGGTGGALTASNGGIVYSTDTAMAILAGTATAGKHLQSGSLSSPSWTTATFPSTASSTGTVLRANGTNWLASTSTFADTYAANSILYASSANTVSGLAIGTANQVLAVNSGGTGLTWTTVATPYGYVGAYQTTSSATSGALALVNNSVTSSGAASTGNVTLGSGAANGIIGTSAVSTGSIYIDVGAATGGSSMTNGSINIGTQSTGGFGKPLEITIGNTGVTTTIDGPGIISFPNLTQGSPTAITASGTTTLTIAQMSARIVRVTQTAAVTLQLPTGTNADTGYISGAAPVNTAFDWSIINTGSTSGAVTVTTNTGHTYVGNATVPISTSAMLRTVKTATNTFITYRVS